MSLLLVLAYTASLRASTSAALVYLLAIYLSVSSTWPLRAHTPISRCKSSAGRRVSLVRLQIGPGALRRSSKPDCSHCCRVFTHSDRPSAEVREYALLLFLRDRRALVPSSERLRPEIRPRHVVFLLFPLSRYPLSLLRRIFRVDSRHLRPARIADCRWPMHQVITFFTIMAGNGGRTLLALSALSLLVAGFRFSQTCAWIRSPWEVWGFTCSCI